VINTVYRCSWR